MILTMRQAGVCQVFVTSPALVRHGPIQPSPPDQCRGRSRQNFGTHPGRQATLRAQAAL